MAWMFPMPGQDPHSGKSLNDRRMLVLKTLNGTSKTTVEVYDAFTTDSARTMTVGEGRGVCLGGPHGTVFKSTTVRHIVNLRRS